MTEHTDEFKAQYQKKYGDWAGFPQGRTPDYTKCAGRVYDSKTRRFYQCTRKNGHGPHSAWCKQHDPEARESKAEAERQVRFEVNRRAKLRHDLTAERLTIIQQIADGHNDPRALCADYLTRWKEANND